MSRPFTTPQPSGADRNDLRIGDSERAAAAERLAAHAAAGRLSVDELEQRVDAAYSATHRAELAALEADLPRPGAAGRRVVGFGGTPIVLAVALAALCLAASVAVGHPVGFPLLLAFLAWRLLARRPRRPVLIERSAP